MIQNKHRKHFYIMYNTYFTNLSVEREHDYYK